MNCAKCGAKLENVGGAEWLGIPMLCSKCCGKTPDNQLQMHRGPYYDAIGMPQGSFSYGRRARKTATGGGNIY